MIIDEETLTTIERLDAARTSAIVSAVNALPILVAEVRRLRAEVARLRAPAPRSMGAVATCDECGGEAHWFAYADNAHVAFACDEHRRWLDSKTSTSVEPIWSMT